MTLRQAFAPIGPGRTEDQFHIMLGSSRPSSLGEFHFAWTYKLHGQQEARVMFPHGAHCDEVIERLEHMFGSVVEYVRLAGGAV